MLEIKITIEAPGLENALNHTADVLESLGNAGIVPSVMADANALTGTAAKTLEKRTRKPRKTSQESAPIVMDANTAPMPAASPAAASQLAETADPVTVPMPAPATAMCSTTAAYPAENMAAIEAPIVANPTVPMPVVPNPTVPMPVVPKQPAGPATPISEQPVTREQVAMAGAALLDEGKMPELIALLKEFNVQAITQLSDAQIPQIADRLRAMGAKL